MLPSQPVADKHLALAGMPNGDYSARTGFQTQTLEGERKMICISALER